jgi:hypothetical protein
MNKDGGFDTIRGKLGVLVFSSNFPTYSRNEMVRTRPGGTVS